MNDNSLESDIWDATIHIKADTWPVTGTSLCGTGSWTSTYEKPDRPATCRICLAKKGTDRHLYASECDLCETDGHLHYWTCPNNPLRQKGTVAEMMIRTLPCPHCKKTSDVEVTEEQYQQLMDGTKHIQVIFKNWPVEKRELLITGTHPKCWIAIFEKEDY